MCCRIGRDPVRGASAEVKRRVGWCKMVSQTHLACGIRVKRDRRLDALDVILCATHGDVKRRVGWSKTVSQTGPSLRRTGQTRAPQAFD
jgi:hypothetical protein